MLAGCSLHYIHTHSACGIGCKRGVVTPKWPLLLDLPLSRGHSFKHATDLWLDFNFESIALVLLWNFLSFFAV